jgi:hypothetical protein
MDYSILAHAGGLDEMAIILFPLLVGGGVWLMTRGAGPKGKDKSAEPPPPPLVPKAPTVRFAPPDPKSKPRRPS